MPSVIGTSITSPTLPIRLRPAESSKDAADLSALFSNPDNTELDHSTGSSASQSVAKLTERIDSWQTHYASDRPERCNLIVETTSGEFLGIAGTGCIKYFPLEGADASQDSSTTTAVKKTEKSVADVGVMLHGAGRGKGYGTEAMKLSITFVFESLGVDEVTVHTDAANKPMIAVMQRLGWPGKEIVGEHGEGEVAYVFTKAQWEAQGRKW